MKKHIHHIHIYILAGLVVLAAVLLAFNAYLEKISLKNNVLFGVSFSPRYAESLGLNPKETYLNILQDLKIKNMRLNAYWDEIEPFEGKPFYFDQLDWYIEQAQMHGAQVILAIGYKLPRWPECRAPSWLNLTNLRNRQLNMLEGVIHSYNQNPTISAFQIENEPLLRYGICPPPDREFLVKEVEFVRSKTKKPIIITDSGELAAWIIPMQISDIFGTTLYRNVENDILGQVQYPLQPWFYRVKSALVRRFFAPNNQKTIISELQAESWSRKSLTQVPVNQQIENFSLEKLKKTILFARRTGFDEAYLWGVEWWYYLAANGHPEYLDFANGLF